MKKCLKCGTEFTPQKGLLNYCSFSCRNSRTFNEESRKKKSQANKEWYRNLSSEDKEKHKSNLHSPKNIEKRKQTYRYRLLNSDFNSLSYESKRKRIIIEQGNKCNHCGLDEWNGKSLLLEIDHINGIGDDDKRENMEAICPNCHSQTFSFRGKNKPRKNGDVKVSDEELLTALKNKDTIRQALIEVGLSPKGGNYKRAKRLLGGAVVQ
ncbi:MAG: HNH endonuclease [Promethearchaeia archaeon]